MEVLGHISGPRDPAPLRRPHLHPPFGRVPTPRSLLRVGHQNGTRESAWKENNDAKAQTWKE